jgi:hypothetical protein
MNEKDQIELVNRHADALARGGGLGLELAEPDLEARQLLTIAGRVKSVLRPAPPRPAFVNGLKQRLVAEARQQATQRRHQWLMVAAGLGGLVYGLSVLAVGFRTSVWMFGLVAVALGWNKQRTAAPVVKTAP